MPFRRRTRAPEPPDPGLAEIDAWRERFLAAHELRLSRDYEFPDRHLVDEERARVNATATAVHARMRSDYLARQRR